MQQSTIARQRRVRLGCALAAAALLILPGLAGAQNGSISLSINQVLSEEFPHVTAYVTVVDDSGLPILGLEETEFALQEDGAPIAQAEVSQASVDGINVLLALDTSGSMLGGTAMSDAQEAASTFLSQLGPSDQAGLIVFSEQADLVHDLTDDFAALDKSVQDVEAQPNARTALYEAVSEAAERIAQLPPGRRAIVVFTDGTDTVGGYSLKDAIDRAQESNVPLYTVGLVGGEFDPAPMRQLAEATNGFYLEAPSSGQLTATFQRVRDLLEQQYAIRFVSSLHPEDRYHELGITVSVDGSTAEDHHAFLTLPLIPYLEFTQPSDGDRIAGVVDVVLNVASRFSIAELNLLANDTPIATLTGPPYRAEWDTSPLAPGSWALSAEAVDIDGRQGQARIAVDVSPVLTLSIVSPSDGADVVGVVEVQPDIHAFRKLGSVQVSVDGQPETTLPAEPYTFRWDTAEVAPGTHDVTIRAIDVQGVDAEATVRVSVQPVLTTAWVSPDPSAELTSTVTLVAAAQSHYGIERIEFYSNADLLGAPKEPPFELTWSTLNLDPGPYQMSACAYDLLGHRDCADMTLQLEVPGPSLFMFASLGFVLVALILVTVMVVRSRQRQARARGLAHPVPVGPTSKMRSQAAAPSGGRADSRPTLQGPRVLPSGTGAQAWFVLSQAAGAGQRDIPLRPGAQTLGRATDCDIVIDDDLASRHHSLVEYDDRQGMYVYRDQSPTNPTIINGREYVGPHTLQPGDTIVIGSTTLTFHKAG